MQESTEKRLKIWLNSSPESFHQLDMERFYAFIKEAQDNNELDEIKCMDLEGYIMETKPQWNATFVDSFTNEWLSNIAICCELLEYINSRSK